MEASGALPMLTGLCGGHVGVVWWVWIGRTVRIRAYVHRAWALGPAPGPALRGDTVILRYPHRCPMRSPRLERPHGRYRRTFEPRNATLLTTESTIRTSITSIIFHKRHKRTGDARALHVACVTAHGPTARHIDGRDGCHDLRRRGRLGRAAGPRAVAVERARITPLRESQEKSRSRTGKGQRMRAHAGIIRRDGGGSGAPLAAGRRRAK